MFLTNQLRYVIEAIGEFLDFNEPPTDDDLTYSGFVVDSMTGESCMIPRGTGELARMGFIAYQEPAQDNWYIEVDAIN